MQRRDEPTARQAGYPAPRRVPGPSVGHSPATRVTMEGSPSPARGAAPAKSDSLRLTLSPPGLAAWGGLPERDRAMLRWLLVGDVVTSELAALLAYGSLRTARRRLARLVELGLVRGSWAANSQRPRGRYAYALVDWVRRELEGAGPSPERRRGRERLGTMTIHRLATNDLLAAFLRHSDPDARRGLAAWLPERAVAPLFDGYVRPDALAIVGTPRARISLLLERDLGTEGAAVVAAKAARYAALLRGQTDPAINVGVVVESRRRLGSLRRAIEVGGVPDLRLWLVTSAELAGRPYGATWMAPDGRECPTSELPSEPVQGGGLVGALCLGEPDGIEAFEIGALAGVRALERFTR